MYPLSGRKKFSQMRLKRARNFLYIYRNVEKVPAVINKAIIKVNGLEPLPLLVRNLEVDLEKETDLQYNGCSLEGVAALWVTASKGHVKTVGALVCPGADMNHPVGVYTRPKVYTRPIADDRWFRKLEIDRLFDHHWDHDDNAISIKNITCLMTAADKGHNNKVTIIKVNGLKVSPLILSTFGSVKTLQLLVRNFKLDLEKETDLRYDGCSLEGVTALWVAASKGYIKTVRALVCAGADVNHPAKLYTSPLEGDCWFRRLEIFRFFHNYWDHDGNVISMKNMTCLMIAADKGHDKVVRFLLQNGANPNSQTLCGNTALHFASQRGHAFIVEVLLNYGAQLLSNDEGITPILSAAERAKCDVVECFLWKRHITRIQQIEALELLGASCAIENQRNGLNRACKYITRSMELRFSDKNNPIYKNVMTPIPAYQNRVECRTMLELLSIRSDENAIFMEALTIRERILGHTHPRIPNAAILQGAYLAKRLQFDRCLNLWLYALHLKQNQRLSLMNDVKAFLNIFMEILDRKSHLNFDHVAEVLSVSISEVKGCKEKLRKLGPRDNRDSIWGVMDRNIKNTIYLITMLTKLSDQATNGRNSRLMHMVSRFNQLRVSQRNGKTALHIACDNSHSFRPISLSVSIKYPCIDTVNLLIECGADVNAPDEDGNTPLHMIVHNRNINDIFILQLIMSALLAGGAHIDYINKYRKTALQYTRTDVAKSMLTGHKEISLKCIVARLIRKHNLKYKGEVPKELDRFIDRH